jgi:hypothetical protein
MSLSIGIVGLPNVGKSTLFNALVKQRQATASNFAFCTIDPNVGIVNVPDERLQKLADIVHPEKITPATVEFIDIAGLVKEAHKGEGLGNKFLSHIRNTDAICMVLRCFEDENIMHVAGKINPKEDFETIITELELADLSTKEKIEKKAKKGGVDESTIKYLSKKPLIFAANVAEKDANKSPEEIIKKYNLDFIDDPKKLIVISARVEQDLIDLDENEQKEYLESLGLEKSGLDRLIQVAYHTLNLQSYLTAGPKEVRAWTIPIGSTAPQAAGKIHTDFERGFIKAEVISFNDYIKYNGEAGAKDAGRLRQEGKDYIVKDGDIIEFKFNV